MASMALAAACNRAGFWDVAFRSALNTAGGSSGVAVIWFEGWETQR